MSQNDRPTLYLSNWSSHKTPGHHGPGKKYTIMAKPRRWEHGDGCVSVLCPEKENLEALHEKFLTVRAYKELYIEQVMDLDISNGMLYASDPFAPDNDSGFPIDWPVEDGDTLCCSCSRDNAALGLCHRAWIAPLLVDAGWRVILDGKEFKARTSS